MEHTAKKARTSAAPSAVSIGSYVDVDEMHAVHLARHLADLYERSRFTDLRVRRRTIDCLARADPRSFHSTQRICFKFKYAPRCGAATSCSRCTRAW